MKKSFPVAWTGNWQGSLNIHAVEGESQSLPMNLQISPIKKNQWSWTITYGEGETTEVRNYELLATDFEKGTYLLDEKNSVHIPFYLHANAFHSLFAVPQNLLSSTYELRDEQIYFSIIIYDLSQPLHTGGENNMPTVDAYRVKSVQKAVLAKSH